MIKLNSNHKNMQHKMSDFFEHINTIKYIRNDNYAKVNDYFNALKAVSKICDLSYYVIDYYRKNFFYVSRNPLFLCGYTQEEVLKMGYDFFGVCIPEADLQLFFELNKAGFKLFYELPLERRKHFTISYDFRFRNKDQKSLIMLKHRLTPFLLTEDGDIWMAICLVTLSSMQTPGSVHVVTQDDQNRYDYNRRDQIFKESKIKKLTKREYEILKLIALGNCTEEISRKLVVSTSTIKNHKTQIFKKLGVKTAAEAVFIFTSGLGFF